MIIKHIKILLTFWYNKTTNIKSLSQEHDLKKIIKRITITQYNISYDTAADLLKV